MMDNGMGFGGFDLNWRRYNGRKTRNNEHAKKIAQEKRVAKRRRKNKMARASRQANR
jgi:hypothetical protein